MFLHFELQLTYNSVIGRKRNFKVSHASEGVGQSVLQNVSSVKNHLLQRLILISHLILSSNRFRTFKVLLLLHF